MAVDTLSALRPVEPTDLSELADLVNRVDLSDGVKKSVQPDELGEELESSLTTMVRDTRVAIAPDGTIRGFAWTVLLPGEGVDDRCYVVGGTDPDHRGLGIGGALAEWSVAHARGLLDARPGPHGQVIRAFHHVDNASGSALAASLGFAPVRWFEDMVRPLDQLPARSEIAGATIQPWPTDDPLDDAIRLAKNAAFADHWGSSPTTVEGWAELVQGFGGRPDLSLVARDETNGEVVALLLTKRFPADDEATGRVQACIDKIATVRAWRGRGLASALIAEALHRYAAEGMTHATIDVDADNPTGASRLYRAVGFETEHRFVTSEIVHRTASGSA
ncbi:MAG: GNAT family N-acetyltransferase [Actinobacteria bacterium]|nr:GNAT family N-acetyltransferase [Actinomycetota bacterium]